MRTDSLYVGVFRISQVVGFVCFVVGTLLLVLGLVKARRARLTAMNYTPSYPTFATTASIPQSNDVSDNHNEQVVTEDNSDTNEDIKKAENDVSDISQKLEKIFNIETDNKEE